MTEKKIKWFLLAFLIAFTVAWVLTACSTEKKAQRKVSWLLAHDLMDDNCSRLYPNQDSTIYRDSISFDTLIVQNDVIVRDTVLKGDTLFVEKKCPPEKVITKTVHDSVFIYRSNTAEVERWKGEALEKDKVIKAKDDLITKQQLKIDKNDKWRLWFFILAFAIMLGIVFRLFIYKRPI